MYMGRVTSQFGSILNSCNSNSQNFQQENSSMYLTSLATSFGFKTNQQQQQQQASGKLFSP
ncbi:hypothetical protein LEP1GSC080_0312 [Leptospira interrogans str. FPW2026]|nr:hypothetical protein LEP1GSC080_0312 [Leptospira interrogans str. FPW2026]